MTQLDEALHLEALFQMFRSQHAVGNGGVHRAKFLKILQVQSEIWNAEEERKKIKIAFA